ncbi:hypothetical protein IMZ68_04525 [Candidatus Bathyarchaeota archaeon]|nr:hypothetical protein [Candidatus Bathyarchaeota archaeon]
MEENGFEPFEVVQEVIVVHEVEKSAKKDIPPSGSLAYRSPLLITKPLQQDEHKAN